MLCWFGAHDWYNDGVATYDIVRFSTPRAKERLVQRCERCYAVRFL